MQTGTNKDLDWFPEKHPKNLHLSKTSAPLAVAAMKGGLVFALFCLFASNSVKSSEKIISSKCHKGKDSLHDFQTQDIHGNNVSLSKFKHQIVMAINVATFWGLTSQYHNMNALMVRYSQGKCGFQVLGFPCNQFGKQEPGANADEILNGLKYVRPGNGFVPNFPMFKKRDVNGKTEDQIYAFFKVTRFNIRLLNLSRLFTFLRD